MSCWPSTNIHCVELKLFHTQIPLWHFDFLSSKFLELLLCSYLKYCLREMGNQCQEHGCACWVWGESWKCLLTGTWKVPKKSRRPVFSLMSWGNRPRRFTAFIQRYTVSYWQMRSLWRVFFLFLSPGLLPLFHVVHILGYFAFWGIPVLEQPLVLEFGFPSPSTPPSRDPNWLLPFVSLLTLSTLS